MKPGALSQTWTLRIHRGFETWHGRASTRKPLTEKCLANWNFWGETSTILNARVLIEWWNQQPHMKLAMQKVNAIVLESFVFQPYSSRSMVQYVITFLSVWLRSWKFIFFSIFSREQQIQFINSLSASASPVIFALSFKVRVGIFFSLACLQVGPSLSLP